MQKNHNSGLYFLDYFQDIIGETTYAFYKAIAVTFLCTDMYKLGMEHGNFSEFKSQIYRFPKLSAKHQLRRGNFCCIMHAMKCYRLGL